MENFNIEKSIKRIKKDKSIHNKKNKKVINQFYFAITTIQVLHIIQQNVEFVYTFLKKCGKIMQA